MHEKVLYVDILRQIAPILGWSLKNMIHNSLQHDFMLF